MISPPPSPTYIVPTGHRLSRGAFGTATACLDQRVRSGGESQLYCQTKAFPDCTPKLPNADRPLMSSTADEQDKTGELRPGLETGKL